MRSFASRRKKSTAILIEILICVQALTPLFAAAQAEFESEADGGGQGLFVPTFVMGSNPIRTFTITNPGLFSKTASADARKEYILDLLARISVGVLITALTNQVIGWIQGDDGANVGFVGNLDEAFRKEANLAGGEFLNNLAGIDLCTANLRGYLNISLRTPGLQQRLGCTLSGIGANAESFFQDFSQGGWPAFLKIGLEPQNNPYGAYLIALDSKLALEDAAGRRVALGFQAGQGFLGGRGAVRKKEVSTVQVQDADVEGNEFTREEQRITSHTEYNTKTPGGLVAQTLAKTVNIGYDFAVVSDEIDEAITAIVNTLINKLVSSTYSLVNSETGEEETGEGVFTSELSDLPFGAAELADSSIPKNADELLFTTDIGLTTADKIISAASRNLFITRRQIEEILESPEPLTASQQTRLADLRDTEAKEDKKLSAVLNQKDRLLALSASDILPLKETFQTAISAEEIVAATERIQPAAQSLNSIMQEIEAIDDATSIPLPPIPAGVAKTDTLTELNDATLQISSMTSLLREMQTEVKRLANQEASTTPQRKIALDAKSKDIDAEVIRLGESRTAIAGVRTALERATETSAITTEIGNAITEMLTTQRELQRANTLMKDILPLLKPE